MKKLSVVLFCTMLAACATPTVTRIGEHREPLDSKCQVSIYQTQALALKQGQIQELCVVSGNSAPGWDHSIKGAIKKTKKKVCGCGADNAYIQSQSRQSDMGLSGVSYVTLVGFRYLADSETSKKPDVETIRKAKRCQEKGGLWVNDVCQIEID